MSGNLVLQANDLPLDLLATDLARRLYTPQEIADRYSTDLDTIWELLQRPEYYKLVKQRQAAWLSSANTGERARLLAQITKIEALPLMFGIISDPKAPTQTRVDAYKAVDRGSEDPAAMNGSGATGRGFQVVINLGENHAPMTIEGKVPASDPAFLTGREDEEEDL
jgi:hypothetical protein